MTAASTLGGTELVAGVQSSANVKITIDQIKTWASNTPTLVTPVLGVATATSVNKVALTAPATSATLTVADGKTLTASNTLTLAGTDSTVMTFPSTSATIARTDAANTFTGTQSYSGAVTFTVAASGPILKQGANGRVGTFVANGVTPVTVNNTSVAVTDAIIISLNTAGGTVGTAPSVQTITAGVGFTVAGIALDSSTYNYCIIKNSA